MRKILSLFAVALLSFGLVTVSTDADAKRFGGGSSFGKQRQTTSRQAEPAKPAQAPAAAPAPGGNRWLGPLAGLAAGGLLASLFMGHGFDGINFMDILMMLALAGGAFMIFRMLRRPAPAAPRPMQYAGYGEQTLNGMTGLGGTVPAPAVEAAPSTRPDWFQDEPFLREAKAHFIRLQAAYDAADLNDIREYTTPEVFAEISLQLQERGGKASKTEVVTLNAEMADVATEGDLVIASVRFSGLLREDSPQATPFSETWHIQKSLSQPNASWYVAGIQQN
jgi:Uncharacterized protein conserved in bacteria